MSDIHSSSTYILPLVPYIRKHSLLSFFITTFIISWAIWFIEPSLRSTDSITAGLLITLGSFGPILAAMVISTFLNPGYVYSPLKNGLTFGILALSVSIFCNWSTPTYLGNIVAHPLPWFFLAILTILPGMIFFCSSSGINGLHGLLNSLTNWRNDFQWLVFALGLMPAISLAGVVVTTILTGKPLTDWATFIRNNSIMQNLALVFLNTAFYGGPLGEEAGWRGFALPYLQKRYSPLLASIFIGVIWSFWHLPLHLTGYYNNVFGNPINGLISRTLMSIPLSIAFTWLYNRSHGNLLAMVILHTMVNITPALIPPDMGMYIVAIVALALMVFFDRMYETQRLKNSTS